MEHGTDYQDTHAPTTDLLSIDETFAGHCRDPRSACLSG
jgi:hypothetical protein